MGLFPAAVMRPQTWQSALSASWPLTSMTVEPARADMKRCAPGGIIYGRAGRRQLIRMFALFRTASDQALPDQEGPPDKKKGDGTPLRSR